MPPVPHRTFIESAVVSRLSRLVVTPRFPMIGSVTGLHRSATRGSSVEFAEYRKYAPGDDIRRLDWRVFARTDRFFMKEYEADTNLRAYLVLDASGSMNFEARGGRKFDYACRLAATLAYLLAHQGDAVGLLLFGEKREQDIPPRRSPAHLKNIFDAMATAKPHGTSDVVDVLHRLAEKARRRAMVIVFSDFFTDVPPLLDAFQHMRFCKHDLAVFHLLDRQEVDFQFDRPIRFADLESSFSLISDPSMIAAGYREELDRYLDLLQKGTREHNVDYQRVVTDTPYEQALASFLLQRMNKAAAAAGGRA